MMSDPTLSLVTAGLAVVTIATRSFFLVVGDYVRLPARLQQGLRYAPACALAALIFPQLVMADGALHLSLLNPRLDAGLVAILAMRLSGNMLASMLAGMGALALLRAVV